jgi:hypothetical protein
MSFRLEGVKKMRRRILTIADKMTDRVKIAIVIEAEMVMSESKSRLVPVDLGTLRASGRVSQPFREGNNITILLGFGGAASEYAWIQHEVDFNHNAEQTWKYLERPLMASVSGMSQRLAAEVGKAL